MRGIFAICAASRTFAPASNAAMAFNSKAFLRLTASMRLFKTNRIGKEMTMVDVRAWISLMGAILVALYFGTLRVWVSMEISAAS